MTEKREESTRREAIKQVGKAALAAPAVALLFKATEVSALPTVAYCPPGSPACD
jgi:hypothetical protein